MRKCHKTQKHKMAQEIEISCYVLVEFGACLSVRQVLEISWLMQLFGVDSALNFKQIEPASCNQQLFLNSELKTSQSVAQILASEYPGAFISRSRK
jgi:hypothetical protein